MATVLDDFHRAYVECALWSSCLGEEAAAHFSALHGYDYMPDDSVMHAGFTIDGLSEGARSAVAADCTAFLCEPAMCEYLARGHDAAQAGHDFWLTRNRHGAGFWDRGLGELGDRLTDAAHAYGSQDIYVGDDGLLYVS